MSLPPPVPPYVPPTPAQRARTSQTRTLIILGVFLGAGLLMAAVRALQGDDTSSDPAGIEVCTALRSPDYRTLNAGDWARIARKAGIGPLRTYVTERCPDQLDRI